MAGSTHSRRYTPMERVSQPPDLTDILRGSYLAGRAISRIIAVRFLKALAYYTTSLPVRQGLFCGNGKVFSPFLVIFFRAGLCNITNRLKIPCPVPAAPGWNLPINRNLHERLYHYDTVIIFSIAVWDKTRWGKTILYEIVKTLSAIRFQFLQFICVILNWLTMA